MLHVHIGAFTMRFDRAAVSSIWETLGEALSHRREHRVGRVNQLEDVQALFGRAMRGES
jgi:hypothetical protein